MDQVRTGQLELVEFGDQRFEAAPAPFMTENKGAGTNGYVDGNIGAGLHDRIAFVERAGDQGRWTSVGSVV